MRLEKKDFLLLIPATLLAVAGLGPDDPWVVGPCLFLSWVTFIVICVIHEGSPRTRTIVGVVITIVLFGVGYRRFNSMYHFTAEAVSKKDEPKSEGPTSVKVEFGPYFLNMTQSLEQNGFYWVFYRSGYGDTASPVALTIWVSATNPNSIPLGIKNYSLSIKTQNCGWVYLSPIDERAVTAAWTYGGLQNASIHDFHRNGLNVAWSQPIPAHESVEGWLLFDTKIACDISPPQTVQFKLEVTSTLGETFTVLSPERDVSGKANELGTTVGQPHHPSLFHTGKHVDITKFHRKLWSAPIS
jgi:hypothetical protein